MCLEEEPPPSVLSLAAAAAQQYLAALALRIEEIAHLKALCDIDHLKDARAWRDELTEVSCELDALQVADDPEAREKRRELLRRIDEVSAMTDRRSLQSEPPHGNNGQQHEDALPQGDDGEQHMDVHASAACAMPMPETVGSTDNEPAAGQKRAVRADDAKKPEPAFEEYPQPLRAAAKAHCPGNETVRAEGLATGTSSATHGPAPQKGTHAASHDLKPVSTFRGYRCPSTDPTKWDAFMARRQEWYRASDLPMPPWKGPQRPGSNVAHKRPAAAHVEDEFPFVSGAQETDASAPSAPGLPEGAAEASSLLPEGAAEASSELRAN